MSTTNRLYYLDNLRIAVIILVIAHHVGQAYGPTGGSWPIMETERAAWLGPFFTVNRSFFMSLFFMISGYFTVLSCRSKGPGPFMKDRLTRLGLPVFWWGLMMIPMQLFVFKQPLIPIEVGHLWFLEHLLIFSGVYALIQNYRKDDSYVTREPKKIPGYLTIVLFALGLAVVSAVVRIWFPIDRWVYLLGFIRVAFADVPRDLSFFIIGVVASRQEWFSRFPVKTGYVWLTIGVTLAVLWYAYALALWKIFPVSDIAMGVIYPIWESLLCCGMCIGLTVLFREKFNTQGPLLKTMAQGQYAAYIFHVIFVLLFQFLILSFDMPPTVKFLLVTLFSVPVTFLYANWARKSFRL